MGWTDLQLLHLAGPAAAFLTVDTADSEGQDLLLQLRVRVDLHNTARVNETCVRTTWKVNWTAKGVLHVQVIQ